MIDYVGEHTFIGQLGNFFIVLAFVAAIFSAVSYYLAHRDKVNGSEFVKLGRWGFRIHSLSVLGIVLVLFYMLINQYFEYDYVWKHSNTEMPLRYIFSCFWEGQEGSFLLWIFWHCVLGNILIRSAKSWEPLVLLVFALVQVFLVTMILGIYIFDYKLGSNPFILIRNLPENVGLPWTKMPNYLQEIPSFSDGRGLNPLLQNYWMTIHPPTLFLGFSSTLVPFAYAIAGLWSGKMREWIKPAIPWAFFSVSALGIGILMGGAWAYEALSFGGFWAWDPVENSSLVPWLTLVGAAHVMVINQRKNNSLFTAYFLAIITFVLVLYSTFLTRSGVLGDTSVHSFTGEGMIGQLLLYLLFFIWLSVHMLLLDKKLRGLYLIASVFLLIIGAFTEMKTAAVATFILTTFILLIISYNKFFPKAKEEEKLWSREFWVFIGSIVLVLSATQITFETSKPVWNLLAAPFSDLLMGIYNLTGVEGFQALAEGKLAPHSDVISHYNKWQVPFAFVVTFLIAVGQFFRYKNTPLKQFVKSISLSFILSLVIAAAAAYLLNYESQDFALIILLFTCIFAVVANAHYIVAILRGKWDVAGASVSHIGFTLILLGALISTSKSEKISVNSTGINIEKLNEEFDNNEDILLFLGDTVAMNKYFIRYRDKEKIGINMFYNVEYFDLHPGYYTKGTYVIARGAVFRAIEDHKPTRDFIMDQKYWEIVEDPRDLHVEGIRAWSPYRPGEKMFELRPRIQTNPKFGNVPEPSTKHYWNRDIYTHVRWAELEAEIDPDGYRGAQEEKMSVGDSLYIGNRMIRLNALKVVNTDEERERFALSKNDLAVKAMMGIKDSKGEVYIAEPLFILRDSVLPIPDIAIVDELGLKFTFEEIDPETGEHTFTIAEHVDNRKEFIVMQAIVFPMINILWIGCILMLIGTVMAIRHRYKLSRRKPVKHDA